MVERAAALLADARRPVIVAGGGVISADATAELRALAERLGAPVVTTWNGKGAIDETHPLAGQTIGDTGSTIGNALASYGGRDPERRVPLRRLVDVLVARGRHLRDPARRSSSSSRSTSARSARPIPSMSRSSATRARACATCSTRSGAASRATAYGDEIDRLRAAWESRSR